MTVWYKKIDGCTLHQRYFYVVMNNIADYYISKGYNPICGEVQEIPYDGKKFVLWDCEMLIHDSEKDIFRMITFAENMSHSNELFTYRNNVNDVIINCHLSMCHYPEWCKFKTIPGVCVPTWCDVDLEFYYNKRKQAGEYIDKFMFRGSLESCVRNSVYALMESEHFYGGRPVSREQYFEELTQYKVALSVPCFQEMLYRDVEYMAVGIPLMKFEYLNKTTPSLIPNYHYIGIDRIDDSKEKERLGGDEYVKRYIERWISIKDDLGFLQGISENARKYYEDYVAIGNIEKHFINLLGDA